MALIINHVTAEIIRGGTEEMVKAHIIQGGGGCEAGKMSTEVIPRFIGTQHHRQGIPANQGANTALHVLVTWHRRLLFN